MKQKLTICILAMLFAVPVLNEASAAEIFKRTRTKETTKTETTHPDGTKTTTTMTTTKTETTIEVGR